MSSVDLDHLAHLLIAADTAQLRIRQPLPRRALVSQVIEKSFRTRDQRPVFAVRPQTHVDAVEITFSRDARERRDHEFDEARISFVLCQRLNWRGDERVVSDQDVEVRAVIDAARAESTEAVKSDSWTTTERTVAARHFPACDEIRDVH